MIYSGIEGFFNNLFEYSDIFTGFDPAEEKSKTTVHIVDTKNMSEKERRHWEEMKRNAVDVEFEEVC